MAPPRTLAIVLAGGAGSRLELLSEHRAKPVLPVGGTHRLIDIPLSNCLHSKITDVWVVQQQHPATLADALGNGRPWDLDRTHGGLLVLPPGQGSDRSGWHTGTADALWKNAPLLSEFDPDVVLVLSADAVYRCDYADLVDDHLGSGAAVTMVTTRVRDEPERYGVVQVDDDRTVREYRYKPDRASGTLISNEVFAFNPKRLIAELDRIARQGGELEDLGDELLPALVEQGTAREYRFDGFWRDLGTVDAFWAAHMDFLPPRPKFSFSDLDWPMVSSKLTPATITLGAGAEVSDVLVGGGAELHGRISRSVIGRGVRIEKGAVVDRSVIMPGAVVRSGAVIRHAVVDTETTIGRDAHVGDDGGPIALVGHGRRVRAGTTVDAGGRYPAPAED
jgi:glucose-1-phosphate adenylyltransferase